MILFLLNKEYFENNFTFYTDNVQFLCEWNIQISLHFRIENIQISKIRRVSLFATFSVC